MERPVAVVTPSEKAALKAKGYAVELYMPSSVDPEREMASLAENGIEYQTIVATLRARMRMLETVIGGRV